MKLFTTKSKTSSVASTINSEYDFNTCLRIATLKEEHAFKVENTFTNRLKIALRMKPRNKHKMTKEQYELLLLDIVKTKDEYDELCNEFNNINYNVLRFINNYYIKTPREVINIDNFLDREWIILNKGLFLKKKELNRLIIKMIF